jgi:hypothetical protein
MCRKYEREKRNADALINCDTDLVRCEPCKADLVAMQALEAYYRAVTQGGGLLGGYVVCFSATRKPKDGGDGNAA